jgi:hypothetical protein
MNVFVLAAGVLLCVEVPVLVISYVWILVRAWLRDRGSRPR